MLNKNQIQDLLITLKHRFETNMQRHKNLSWEKIENKLLIQTEKLFSLFKMEQTGREPDCIGFDEKTNQIIFVDCSKETPKGRMNTCYDDEALESRKKFKPEKSALGLAKEMGIEILTEVEYHHLQTFGEFDNKTSSWIYTPEEVRKLGGALFGDRRFGRVFIYHNGAESYYSVRGFRGKLLV